MLQRALIEEAGHSGFISLVALSHSVTTISFEVLNLLGSACRLLGRQSAVETPLALRLKSDQMRFTIEQTTSANSQYRSIPNALSNS